MDIQTRNWKIRCVIYDCDGVLFDSLEANTKLYNDLCALVGRVPLREEELQYVHTHTVYEAIHFIFGKENDLEKKALESLKQVDLRNYLIYLKMEPHLFQTLEKLKEKGILRVINTNRTTSMKYIMEKYDLWQYFEMVVTALDVKNPKPNPESIEKIIEAFKLKKEEIVFVGDSDVDQQTAKSSGIKFVAYKNKEIANDAYINDHLDLLNCLPN
ncbi:MAG: haloacid dehalogenase [Deltaproteobacteria bacterium CG_4_8_14_3_um_filter_45_9]|nr:MAG: haloacid dehalogenase [Deltaproteobacteria bacterium CG03_land_8_20_14_0_80_45_14]PIX21424.1 MAG: haloacid dehalogenase [Deltaproteobacteria bacterium CG_4_8_14_3_um_filter_45_9]